MKNKPQFNASLAQMKHCGGKKLGQQGTEFFHKQREVRKHATGNFRSRKA
jgi:hypothetical protein